MPPVWIDLQEDIDDNIIQIKNLIEELRPLRMQRFGKAMFDDRDARILDENICSLVQKISKLIKNSEQKLKSMSSQDYTSVNDS